MRARQSVNEGFGKEVHRKCNSVKRFRPFSASLDSMNWDLLRSSPSQISAPTNPGIYQGQVSTEGILHLVNPNLGSNSGMRIFEPRILGSNSGVEFFGPMFSNKKSPLKNSPPRNSPPKIHIKKFGLKNSHCTSAGPFCWEFKAGKSHPWTNTSVGGNFRRTFRTIGPYEFPQEKVWTNDWSIPFSPEIRMDQWRSKFSESFSLDRYWSIECSSLLKHWLTSRPNGVTDREK